MKIFWIIIGLLILWYGIAHGGAAFVIGLGFVAVVILAFLLVGAFIVGCLHVLARSIDDDLQDHRRNRSY